MLSLLNKTKSRFMKYFWKQLPSKGEKGEHRVKRIRFAPLFVTIICLVSACSEVDDLQQLKRQIAELQEVNRKLDVEIMELNEKLDVEIKELNEKLSVANTEIQKLREENSQNLNRLFR